MSNDLIPNEDSSNNEKKFIRRKNVKQEVFNTIERDGKIYIDSREVAVELNLQHHSLICTIDKYKEKIEKKFGLLEFQILIGKKRGVPVRYVLLDEYQATFLCTLSKNTEEVMDVKAKISRTFVDARRLRDEINLQNEIEKISKMSKADLFLLVGQTLKDKEVADKKIILLEEKIEEDKEKVEAFNFFFEGKGYYKIATAAKMLSKDFIIGSKKLFKFLRDEKILMTGGMEHNNPYQKFMDYFYVRNVNTKVGYTPQTLINAQGIEYLRKELTKKFKEKQLKKVA